MKKLFLLLACTALVIGFSSCSNDEKQIPQSSVSDPFATEDNSVKKSVTVGSYGVKSDIGGGVSYSGGDITATQNITNGGADISLGFIALIDGIPQIVSDNGGVLLNVSLKPEEKYALPLEFTPNCGKKGETLRMDILSMFYPEYIPEQNQFQFGHYQKVMAGMPINVSFEASSQSKEIAIFTEHTVRNPTEFENTYHDLSNSTSTKFELVQDENRDYLVEENNSVNFNFVAYSTCSETFRVSLYKNHIPVAINGCDVADIKLSKGRVTELSITLEDINPGDFVYAIATPMTNNMITPEKTNSMKIMNDDFSATTDNDNQSSIQIGQDIQDEADNKTTQFFLNASDKYIFFCELVEEKRMRIIVKDQNNKVIAMSPLMDTGMMDTGMIEEISLSENIRFIRYNMGKATSVITLNNNLQSVEQLDLEKIKVSRLSLYPQYIDIFNDKLLYKNSDGDICFYDFETEKIIVVNINNIIDHTKVGIVGMRFLNDQTIAFVSQVYDPKSYFIGVLDLSNNNITQKPLSSISQTFDTANGVACWNSKRMNKNEVSDGIIHLYYDNGFHEIVCENPNESQNVFLSNDGKQIATYYASDSDLVVSIYDVKDGHKVNEKTLEVDSNYNTNSTKVCISSGKVYVYGIAGGMYEIFSLEG